MGGLEREKIIEKLEIVGEFPYYLYEKFVGDRQSVLEKMRSTNQFGILVSG